MTKNWTGRLRAERGNEVTKRRGHHNHPSQKGSKQKQNNIITIRKILITFLSIFLIIRYCLPVYDHRNVGSSTFHLNNTTKSATTTTTKVFGKRHKCSFKHRLYVSFSKSYAYPIGVEWNRESTVIIIQFVIQRRIKRTQHQELYDYIMTILRVFFTGVMNFRSSLTDRSKNPNHTEILYNYKTGSFFLELQVQIVVSFIMCYP